MKTIKILLSMLLLCVALVSCKQEEPELSEARALELASYLPDNYTVGDTVYFTTETGETEAFIVKLNLNDKAVFREDDVNEITGKVEYGSENISYDMTTWTESAHNAFQIYINYYVSDGKIVEDVGFTINNKGSIQPTYDYFEGDSIRIEIEDTKCVLKKNIGVVRVSNNEHSWTLKQ